jgi:Subtilase family
MAELPALPLGGGRRRDRSTRATPRPTLRGPGVDRQAQRLGDSLTRLTRAFEAGRLRAEREPGALEPELVLLMEIAGELDDFHKAVSRVPGLEFLTEEVEDKIDPDEFAAVDRDGKEHRYSRQLFLVASDRGAWEQLLSLWRRYQDGEEFPRGLTPFRHVFDRLLELRPWNDGDRLERSGALDTWRRELAERGQEAVLFEAELWLRGDDTRREAAVRDLRADLEAAGGELLLDSVHEAIGYHGTLGRVPADRLREVVQSGTVRWLRTESVRFFHAVGQMAASGPSDGDTEEWSGGGGSPGERAPRLALLDGIPLANHEALANRIVVDDPDGWESTSPVGRRLHGTSMSSIFIHGDMSGNGPPLAEPIYVRPILRADAPDWVEGEVREEVPRDRLVVDLVQAAVARIFEGEAQAPDIRVIVIAIGDAAIQFDQFISPLARMIDWLGANYGVLFIVSAGNHTVDIELPSECDLTNPEEVQHELLCAVQRESAMRRLLCPGESVNALTVGGSHGDLSEALVEDGRLEPIVSRDLANAISAQGSGSRRSIKPDVLFPGGRQTLTPEPVGGGPTRRFSVTMTRRPPGVRHATVGSTQGELKALAHSCGTSVATALAGHRAGELFQQLDELRLAHGEKFPGPDFDAVLLKASLAHAARWGGARAIIDATQEDLGRSRSRMAVGRLVGYGRSGDQSPLVCDDQRVTVVGAGHLIDGKADVFSLPLPQSLASNTTRRRVGLTLAWLTPINPGHRHYRRAALRLETGGYGEFIGKRSDADRNMVGRGTLQRELFESDAATPFAAGNAIELSVSCRADAGDLSGSVPYALLATIEVPEGTELPIYEEVREALRVPIQVRVR